MLQGSQFVFRLYRVDVIGPAIRFVKKRNLTQPCPLFLGLFLDWARWSISCPRRCGMWRPRLDDTGVILEAYLWPSCA
jgi:hypothetical protein